MKIIILVYYPYSSRDHHRWGGEYFIDNGHDVEVWRLLDKNSVNMKYDAGMYTGSCYSEHVFDEFKELVNKNLNAYYLLPWLNKKVIIYLSQKKCKYILLYGVGPVLRLNETRYKRVLKVINSGLLRICKSFAHRLKFYLNLDKIKYNIAIKKHPPLLIATSTHEGAKSAFTSWELKNSNIMYIHAMDYDRYIETERNPSHKESCIVFCDSGFAEYDFDSNYLFEKNPCEYLIQHRIEYYNQLEQLFQKLETHYQLPIKILGHPHNVYKKDAYNGREIIFNQTALYTKNAKAFLLNTSTAINFAEIYDIPTMQIVNRYFKKIICPPPNTYDFIKWESEVLGCGFLDMDNENDMLHPWDFIRPFDRKKREIYMKRFVIDSSITDKTIIECIDNFMHEYKLTSSS